MPVEDFEDVTADLETELPESNDALDLDMANLEMDLPEEATIPEVEADDDLAMPEEEAANMNNILDEVADLSEIPEEVADETIEDLADLDIGSNMDDLDLPEIENVSLAEDPLTEDLSAELGEMEVEAAEIDAPLDKNIPDNDDLDLSNAENSVDAMETAVEIDCEIKDMALKASQTAKEATVLALEVSAQAQASAAKMQAAIVATFNATERAFEAAKKADYAINISALSTQESAEHLQSKIEEIKQQNESLKSVNQELSSKIQQLTK